MKLNICKTSQAKPGTGSQNVITGDANYHPIGPKRACAAAGFLLLVLSLNQSQAATSVSGPVSGTWTANGSPYYVGADASVAAGQALTVNPGVEVVLWPGVNFSVSGRLAAMGTTGAHVIFRGTSSSNYWGRLVVYYGGTVSVLSHCDISDAAYGLYLYAADVNATMETDIQNCSFRNCQTACIYGESVGNYYWNMGNAYARNPILNPTIRNCCFRNSGSGCNFYIWGHDVYVYGAGTGWTVYSFGYANPILMNNIFQGISGSALALSSGTDAGGSVARFVNNTVVSCGHGLVTADPFDTMVTNNIFRGCTVGVQRSGSSSLQVQYNCLTANSSNFAGYPATYGQALISNRNGTPCDAFFNIFQDPRFLDLSTLLLATNSPCVDGGAPTISDACFSVSRGTALSDIGAYGGPYACNWPPPTPPSPPVIIRSPLGQTHCIGEAASFSVTASGGLPLSYQWYLNNNILSGQTGTNLTLSSVGHADAGWYSVVVTNLYGSTNSAPVRLEVYDACIDLHMYAGLNIRGQQGSTYVLSYTTDLNNTNNWVPVATNIMGSSGWFYLDMDSPFSPHRFYKAVLR